MERKVILINSKNLNNEDEKDKLFDNSCRGDNNLIIIWFMGSLLLLLR